MKAHKTFILGLIVGILITSTCTLALQQAISPLLAL